MQSTFIQQLGGNKQTKDMVEFARGILQLQKHQGTKSNFIDAAVKYVISDPAIIVFQQGFKPTELDRMYASFDDKLPSDWSKAMHEHGRARLEFWWDLHDKDNKYAAPGLYYALNLMPETADSECEKILGPVIKEFDDAMKKNDKIGNNTALKMMQTYKVLLIDGDNLNEQDRNFAFDNLLTEAILAADKVQPRDENVFSIEMTAICQAESTNYKEMNGLKATALFDDNLKMAKAQGYKNIMQKFHNMTVGLLTLGSLERSEEFNTKRDNKYKII